MLTRESVIIINDRKDKYIKEEKGEKFFPLMYFGVSELTHRTFICDNCVFVLECNSLYTDSPVRIVDFNHPEFGNVCGVRLASGSVKTLSDITLGCRFAKFRKSGTTASYR